MKQTKLRRIEGNINVLRTDLREALGVDDKEIVINQLTQQIIVKVRLLQRYRFKLLQLIYIQGHKKAEVLKFLEDNKF